ncbi:MAG: cupin domain-containing protein [Gammaproteobacteria bacterium]|nr:cupin domain-containing protein [Gammaproteobacteria bacterium]
MPLERAVAHTGRSDNLWSARVRYFNSGNAFALNLSRVPSVQFVDERDRAFDADAPTGLIDMDLSEALETPYPATTPLILSRYARIRAGETLDIDVRASAQLYCVLTGRGTTRIDDETVHWHAGDVLALPGAARTEHRADETAVAWLVTDEPALSFFDLAPVDAPASVIQPVHYHAEDLRTELDRVYQHPDADTFPGYAVVLSHARLEHTRNIHPTMTLALNSLPAGRSQRPHVHSAMALTLCLQGEGVYSLVDGERKDWHRHAVMVTPPGAPHAHCNEGDARMESLVIQDGGLHYYTRTTGFAFVD